MTFRQFVKNNVLRDLENYAAFWMSSVFTIVIFFVFSMDRYHPELMNGDMIENVMNFGQAAILIFSLGFLDVSIHSFIQRKQKTYGTLLMIGMTRKQVIRMILLENLMIGACAIVTGLIIGLVFGHMTIMLMARIIHLGHIRYVFPAQAIRDTVACFLIMFFIAGLTEGGRLFRKPILELISSGYHESRNMKFHPILASAGIILLCSGYALTFFARLPKLMSILDRHLSLSELFSFCIIGLVCLGLFLTFRECTFLLLFHIRRSSGHYLRDGNAIWITGLMDKLKDSVMTMFVSTVMLTAAFSTIVMSISLLTSVRADITKDSPAPIVYVSFAGNQNELDDVDVIEHNLQKQGVIYDLYCYDVLLYGEDRMRSEKFIRSTDYVRQTGISVSLADGEALDVSGADTTGEQIPIAEGGALTVTGTANPLLHVAWRNHCYVVSDKTWEKFLSAGKMPVMRQYAFDVDDAGQRLEVRTACKAIRAYLGLGGYGSPFLFLPRIEEIDLQEYTYEIFGYVDILLSVIFVIASASLLYFRLLNDVKDNLPLMKNLYRFGLSIPEILKIQHRQMQALFLLPVVFGTVSTGFAMNFLVSMQLSSAHIFIRMAYVMLPLLLLESACFALLTERFDQKVKNELIER